MLYDNDYDYELISEDFFDTKYLLSKKDRSKYKEYLLIFCKNNDEIKSEELPSEEYLNRYNNIIATYKVEEIISSCTNFDGGIKYKHYYKIKDKFCFAKYKYSNDAPFESSGYNEEVKKLLDGLICNE